MKSTSASANRHPDKYQVIKRRLKDGLVTALAPYGDAQHASMRAIRRPGWVFLSYAGNPLELPSICGRPRSLKRS